MHVKDDQSSSKKDTPLSLFTTSAAKAALKRWRLMAKDRATSTILTCSQIQAQIVFIYKTENGIDDISFAARNIYLASHEHNAAEIIPRYGITDKAQDIQPQQKQMDTAQRLMRLVIGDKS